jgi:hypothetical protein
MTAEQDKPENDVIDELMSRWLDAELQDSESAESFENIHKSFDAKQICRASELQLVHSLLLQLADRDEVAKEQRIQNVIHKIDTTNPILGKFYSIVRPLVRYGIAAVLIIVFALVSNKMLTNTAMASIDKIISAIDHAGDRTYSITIEGNRGDSRPPPPRDDQYPEQRREPGERAGLDGATLYLRGSDKFVMYQKTPSGRTVMSGSDGQTRWLIRPNKPVLVSTNPEAFRVPMPPDLAAILSLDLKATLLHIRDNYKVKYLKNVASGKKYLDASKINRDFPGPKNIEIWADSETGLLLRIEFADIRMEDEPSLKRVIIELADQKQLPDDWFTLKAHQPADAKVDFISE